MAHLRLLEPAFLLGSLIVGLIAAGSAVVRARGRRSSGRDRALRAGLCFLVGFGAALTAAVTVLPRGARAPERFVSFDLVADLSGHFAEFPAQGELTQITINLLLLSWLALALPLLVPRLGALQTTGICVAAALLIEVLQFALPTGRVASVSDVLLNSVGAAAVATVSVLWLRPRAERWVARGVLPDEVATEATGALGHVAGHLAVTRPAGGTRPWARALRR